MPVPEQAVQELVTAIVDFQRTLRAAIHLQMRGQELGAAAQGVLRMVGEGDSRAAQLAARLGVSAPVLSRHLAELEEAGLLQRARDPQDGRAQILSLSELGARTLERLESERAERITAYLSGWGEADVEEACDVLSRLSATFTASLRADGCQWPEPRDLAEQTSSARPDQRQEQRFGLR